MLPGRVVAVSQAITSEVFCSAVYCSTVQCIEVQCSRVVYLKKTSVVKFTVLYSSKERENLENRGTMRKKNPKCLNSNQLEKKRL